MTDLRLIPLHVPPRELALAARVIGDKQPSESFLAIRLDIATIDSLLSPFVPPLSETIEDDKPVSINAFCFSARTFQQHPYHHLIKRSLSNHDSVIMLLDRLSDIEPIFMDNVALYIVSDGIYVETAHKGASLGAIVSAAYRRDSMIYSRLAMTPDSELIETLLHFAEHEPDSVLSYIRAGGVNVIDITSAYIRPLPLRAELISRLLACPQPSIRETTLTHLIPRLCHDDVVTAPSSPFFQRVSRESSR